MRGWTRVGKCSRMVTEPKLEWEKRFEMQPKNLEIYNILKIILHLLAVATVAFDIDIQFIWLLAFAMLLEIQEISVFHHIFAKWNQWHLEILIVRVGSARCQRNHEKNEFYPKLKKK